MIPEKLSPAHLVLGVMSMKKCPHNECGSSVPWIVGMVLNTWPEPFFYSSAQLCEVFLLSRPAPLQMEILRHRGVKLLISNSINKLQPTYL